MTGQPTIRRIPFAWIQAPMSPTAGRSCRRRAGRPDRYTRSVTVSSSTGQLPPSGGMTAGVPSGAPVTDHGRRAVCLVPGDHRVLGVQHPSHRAGRPGEDLGRWDVLGDERREAPQSRLPARRPSAGTRAARRGPQEPGHPPPALTTVPAAPDVPDDQEGEQERTRGGGDGRDHAAHRREGVPLVRHGDPVLHVGEDVELAPDRVDAVLSLRPLRERAGLLAVAPRGPQERLGVFADVGRGRAHDLVRAAALLGAVLGGEPLQHRGLPGELRAGGVPRAERAVVAGGDVPELASLQIDHEAFEPVRREQHLGRVVTGRLRAHREAGRAADEHRQQAREKEQAMNPRPSRVSLAPHAAHPFRCPSAGRRTGRPADGRAGP